MNWHSGSNRHLARSSTAVPSVSQSARLDPAGLGLPAVRAVHTAQAQVTGVFITLSGASMSRPVLSTALDSDQSPQRSLEHAGRKRRRSIEPCPSLGPRSLALALRLAQ